MPKNMATNSVRVAGSDVEPDVSGGVGASDIVTIRGRDYAVVPVVALVEGVRHPRGAKYPELVLADSFGRHVQTWNGRPVVVDHPLDDAGNAVLASTPDVLEAVYLGTIFDASLEDGKLKVNAYLDLTAIEEATSDAVSAMWERLLEGEVIEVSVGAIVYTEDVSGTYQRKKYRGKWSLVIPDHLAFLSEGTIGACSIEDGCGTFRVQSMGSIQLSEGVRMAAKQHRGAGTRVMTKGTGTGTGKGEGEGKAPAAKEDGGTLKTVRPLSGAAAGGCGCGGSGGDASTAAAEGGGDDEVTSTEGDNTEHEVSLAGLSAAVSRMMFGADTFDGDKRNILYSALTGKLGRGAYPYVVAFSDNTVVWASYDSSSENYKLYQISYTSDANDGVTLSGEPVEVESRQKFVPKSKPGSDTTVMETTGTETTTMSDDTKTATVTAAKKAATVDELLALADAGLAGEVRAAMETSNAARTDTIARIKKLAGGDKLDDAKLNKLPFDVLTATHDTLAAVADVARPATRTELQEAVTDEAKRALNYGARAGADAGAGAGAGGKDVPPRAPRIFEVKSAG